MKPQSIFRPTISLASVHCAEDKLDESDLEAVCERLADAIMPFFDNPNNMYEAVQKKAHLITLVNCFNVQP